MISDKQFEKLLKALENIDSRLEILISIQKATMPKSDISKIEKAVLRFCDKKYTVKDIAKEIGKNQNNIRAILSNLRDKGLIRTVKTTDKIVFERI